MNVCPGCGARVDGGEAGCQQLFESLLARDFGSPLFFRTHRMAVDTYALQHPERYCASAKSLAAHLAGLCQILEQGSSPAIGQGALRAWLDGRRDLARPALPANRGRLTIADVVAGEDPVAYGEAVRRWAESTWVAYTALHELARSWAREASAAGPPRRRR